jgi:hypothetical protein
VRGLVGALDQAAELLEHDPVKAALGVGHGAELKDLAPEHVLGALGLAHESLRLERGQQPVSGALVQADQVRDLRHAHLCAVKVKRGQDRQRSHDRCDSAGTPFLEA